MFITKAFAEGGKNGAKVTTKEGEKNLRENLRKNTTMNNRQIGQAVRRARNINATIARV